mmetsp:Transcript_44851/g.73048  ORF Transcript_44851/g.73048 Transcript_44851/m.73048 type:complete len:108 (+) Transcript_44851:1373-1696(+)
MKSSAALNRFEGENSGISPLTKFASIRGIIAKPFVQERSSGEYLSTGICRIARFALRNKEAALTAASLKIPNNLHGDIFTVRAELTLRSRTYMLEDIVPIKNVGGDA